jgi:hypothetical protein
MRFPSIYTPDPKAMAVVPTASQMEEVGKFIEEMERSGVLLLGGRFLPSSTGLRVRSADGHFNVIESASETTTPFAGLAVLEVNSREEAIENSKRFLRAMGGGESELRQLMDAAPAVES